MRKLAARAGVRDSTVLRLERGDIKGPSVRLLIRIAQGLDTSLIDLLKSVEDGVDNPFPDLDNYLRVLYPQLPRTATLELKRKVEKFLDEHPKAPERW